MDKCSVKDRDGKQVERTPRGRLEAIGARMSRSPVVNGASRKQSIGAGKLLRPEFYLSVFVAGVCLTGTAHAQSSVTLYGLIDEGLNITNNSGGHTVYQMSSGDTYGGRWGLTGKEDLGGGYGAVFRLENGFNINKGTLGQDSSEFGRQAYVGIASQRYGTLTMGRQYDTSVDALGSSVTTGAAWSGAITAYPLDSDNANWDFRVNNAVKYVSPTYAGFTGEAMYAFSNQAGEFSQNSLWGATLNYKQAGLTVAASYLKIDNPGGASGGAINSGDLFDAGSMQKIGFGVSYRLSSVFLAANYSHVDVYDPTSNAFLPNSKLPDGSWNSWKFDNFGFSGQYYFASDFWLGAGYSFTMAHLHSTVGDYVPKWHQLGLMLDYDLSRGTSVYLQAAYQHVVSAHTGTDFDRAQIAYAAAGPASGVNQMVYRIAMIHRF